MSVEWSFKTKTVKGERREIARKVEETKKRRAEENVPSAEKRIRHKERER